MGVVDGGKYRTAPTLLNEKHVVPIHAPWVWPEPVAIPYPRVEDNQSGHVLDVTAVCERLLIPTPSRARYRAADERRTCFGKSAHPEGKLIAYFNVDDCKIQGSQSNPLRQQRADKFTGEYVRAFGVSQTFHKAFATVCVDDRDPRACPQ